MLERGTSAGASDRSGYIRLDSEGTVLDTLVLPSWGPEPDYLRASSADGSTSRAYGLPWGGQTQTSMTPTGGLVSSAREGYGLYLLEPGQRPARVNRSFTPVPVSATERSERREQIVQVMRRLNPDWSWTGADIPTTKPAIRDFSVGDDGRIWVRVYTPGEPIPAEQLPPVEPGPNARVRLTTREPNLYDVFSPVPGRASPSGVTVC